MKSAKRVKRKKVEFSVALRTVEDKVAELDEEVETLTVENTDLQRELDTAHELIDELHKMEIWYKARLATIEKAFESLRTAIGNG